MSGQSLFLKRTENEGRSAQVDQFLAARGAGSGRLDLRPRRDGLAPPICGAGARIDRGHDPRSRVDRDRSTCSSSISAEASTALRNASRANGCRTRRGWRRSWRDVECRAGYTQIARILRHAQHETLEAKVGAVVFIGDACEPSERRPRPVCRPTQSR